MSPKLKPLLLPQLVQERRRVEQDVSQNFVYLHDNASSEMASPVTPTFSNRGGHVRYSSSTSSLDLGASCCSDSPVSPTAAMAAQAASQTMEQTLLPASSTSTSNTSATATKHPTPKRSLPDVQEEPFERDDDRTILPDPLGFLESLDIDDEAYCLCNDSCEHNRPALPYSTNSLHDDMMAYDFDLSSENDCPRGTIRKRRGRSGGGDSPLAGLTSRMRLPSLSRWRSSERRPAVSSLSFTASETTLDHRPSMSRGPSSRSSSVSRGRRPTVDRTNEPPLPSTPALSFYESSAASHDSICLPTPLDIEAANELGKSLERDRAMATTPLLPPVMTQLPPSATPSAPQSPLEFPKMEPQMHSLLGSPEMTMSLPQFHPSPSLSNKPSVSSFRHMAAPSTVSAPATTCASEVSSPMLNFGPGLPQPDVWSDRLGHANFTIVPKPYVPEEVSDLAVLQRLRADWNQARINFTKHLVRTGEHYGTTSKTYQLTEEKWAETEMEWRLAHDSVVDRFSALCNGNGDTSATLRWRHHQEDVSLPSTVPVMLDGEGGKFPAMGDEDIVGPMVRDAAMSREFSPSREGGASRFWKSIMGRVGGLKK